MKHAAGNKTGLAALIVIALAAGALFALGPRSTDRENTLSVFAASSFAWVLRENAGLIQQETGLRVQVVEAASSTLARQIAEGAPADVFVTADQAWLDYLADNDSLRGAPLEVAGNRLGLAFEMAVFADFCPVSFVAEADAPTLYLACPYAGRVATGDPAFVPLGKYAAQAIGHYQWKFPLAPAASARAAMVLFEQGAAGGGIFYVTDIAASDTPLTWFEIPAGAHDPIVYRAAALKQSNEAATENFLNFLKSEAFRTILADAGFETESSGTE